MTYPVDDVTPTSIAPSHHIKLADASGNKVLLNLVRPAGTDRKTRKTIYEPDPESLTRNTFPNQAIRMTNAGGSYADLQPPFQAFEQKTWEGGRGIRLFESDKTRYADAGGTLTHVPHQITLSGLPHYSGGNYVGDAPLEHLHIMPGNFTGHTYRSTALYDTDRYIGRKFTPSNTMVTNKVWLIVGVRGTAPGNLRVDVYSDAPAEPGTSLANGTLLLTTYGSDEGSQTVSVELDTDLTLTAGTFYWVVVSSVTAGSASNHWWVLTDDTVTTASIRSANGTTWGEASPYSAPYFSLLDYYTTASDRVGYKFFEYKRALYAVKIPENGGNATIYRNGYRGAADSNSGALTKLKDSTQTTWGSETVGGIALIIDGPGSQETQPWRNVTVAASGELTVDRAWEIEHTTSTIYVILGTEYWELIHTPAVAGRVNVEVAGEFYFTSFENTNVIRRFREYNLNGVWTSSTATVSNFLADKLLAIRESETGKFVLWGYNNDYALGPAYWKAYVPPTLGDPYTDRGEIVATDAPWNSAQITNVTQRIGIDGTEISIAGAYNVIPGVVSSYDLPTPVSVAEGDKFALLLKSSVVTTTGQLTLKLSNRTYAQQQKLLADYVFHTLKDNYKVATSVSEMVPSTGAHTDKPKLYDGLDDSTDTIPLTTTNDLVVISDAPFNTIQANITVANTTTPLTITAEYFNGEEFVAHIISGNFGGVSNTPFGVTSKQTISFNMPGDWAEYTANGVTGYAMRLKCSGTLLASTALAEISVIDTEAYANRTFANGRDGNDNTDEAFNFGQGDALVVGKSERFDRVVVTMGSVVNASAATLACYYFNGEELVTATIASDGTASGGATLAQSGTITVTMPTDWKMQTFGGVSAYFLHFQVSAVLTEDILIAEVSVYLDEQTYTLDAVLSTADIWTWLTSAITPGSNLAEEAVVRNVSFTLGADLGAQVLYLKDGIRLIKCSPDYHLMNGYRATNLVAYGTAGVRLEPYVFFEATRPHRIDTLAGDVLVPILVTALENLASETNGRAATHSGVYLYFNLGARLQRYFDGSLESVGPDLDEGLPNDRQGIIAKVIPYPGDAVIYVVDAATRDPDFISSVILRSGSGAHELYRAPRGEPIRDLFTQVTPGLTSDRLWINVGSQIVWIPLPSYTADPLKDLDSDSVSNYDYLHEGYVDLGYITDGMQGVVKVYVSLTLVTRNLTSGQLYVNAYYRADNATAWTRVTTAYTTSPVQELAFTTDYINAKKLQIRLRLRKDGGQALTTTPVVEAVIVKAVTIYPASYVYNISALLGDYQPDKENRPQTHKASVDLAQMDTWRNAGTVLTLTDLMVPWSSRKVILNSLNAKVAALEMVPHHEQYYITGQLMDITL